MPEPGGSVRVTARSISRFSWSVIGCAFVAWWLIFWGAWDRLLKGQVFGNSDTGPAAGDMIFILGALLAATASLLIVAKAFWQLRSRGRD
jgi:hypothetical protein